MRARIWSTYEDVVVPQRHVTRHRHGAPADQSRIRDGVVGRATRAGRDPRRAVAGEARDAVDPRGLEGVSERPLERDILVGTPGTAAASPAIPCPIRLHENFSPAVDAAATGRPPALLCRSAMRGHR